MSSDAVEGLEWVVVVPPLPGHQADVLWQEWRSRSALVPAPEDVLVDLIRADGGDQRRYRVRGIVVVDCERLISNLRDLGDKVGRIVDDHVGEHGEVLLHLLVADMRRFVEEGFEGDPLTELGPLLDVLADGLDHGDALVANAVAVSFVEDSCPWQPEKSAFVSTWPSSLRREARRQLDS